MHNIVKNMPNCIICIFAYLHNLHNYVLTLSAYLSKYKLVLAEARRLVPVGLYKFVHPVAYDVHDLG